MLIKTKKLTLKEIDAAGKGLAVFATLNVVDADGDVTLPGAFGEQLAKLLPTHDWGHVPLGKARIYESGEEALADFQLNLEIEAARDWHAALKFDLADGRPLQEWSYGYDATEWKMGEHNGQHVRFLEKLKVHEVSPVVLGAGVGTRTLLVKGLRGRKLADHAATVCAELEDLLERVSGLQELRIEQGRKQSLTEERRAELAELKSAIDALAPLAQKVGALIVSGAAGADEARRLFSQFTEIASRTPREGDA